MYAISIAYSSGVRESSISRSFKGVCRYLQVDGHEHITSCLFYLYEKVFPLEVRKTNNMIMKNLFVIKGNSNTGKSTISALLHEKLSNHPNAVVQCFWNPDGAAVFDINNQELYNNFISVIDIKGRKIGIISQGDYVDCLRKTILFVNIVFNFDVLIVCARPHYVFPMLESEFGPSVCTKHIYQTERIDGSNAQIYAAKTQIVSDIITDIKEVCDL